MFCVLPGYSHVALAHDFGIIQVELRETAPRQFTLSAPVSPSQIALLQPPILPQQCHSVRPAKSAIKSSSVTYAFSCTEALTASDSIDLPWKREGIMLSTYWLGQSMQQNFFSRSSNIISIPVNMLGVSAAGLIGSARVYGTLGLEHIAGGLDHLLFVLCLMMLTQGIMTLVKTITAFTLAHSITLGAGALGIVSLPAAAVEASIALSIGFLAAEIIRKIRFNQSSLTIDHPWLVAFGFGLLHGLGFASAITGMPETDLVPAILFFNLGVELGQIIFIMLVMSIFYLFRRIFVLNMKYINMTTAYCVGSLGCFWFIQRSAPIFS